MVVEPAKKIEPEGVNLLPPFIVSKPEAEKLSWTDIELLVIVTAALLVKLPDILNGDGRLSVNEPVLSDLFTNIREVNPDPEISRLGVALEVIELDKAKLVDIVRVCEPVLSQFALLLDTKDKLDIVEVRKDIGAAPVFVT